MTHTSPSPALALRALARAAAEQSEPAQLLQALRAAAEALWPGRRVLALQWRPNSNIYNPGEPGTVLPPGSGDPTQADDQPLAARLTAAGALPLEAALRMDCWLGRRLRRAGLRQGLLLALPIDAELHALLVVACETPQLQDGLEHGQLMRETLLGVLEAAGQRQPPAPLLDADPSPALVVASDARIEDCNAACRELQRQLGLEHPYPLLPVNHADLVRACLSQRRAIADVEAESGERILLWTYVPVSRRNQVLVRGRDATAQRRAARRAVRSNRLYRLITENTSDMISRHAPNSRFIDASPASWTLLGYWPEELHGQRVDAMLHPDDRSGFLEDARNALTEHGYHTMSYRIRHRDGHYVWFEAASRAIRETYTGAVVEVVSVSRDITPRVRAEENTRRLAQVVEATTDLVLFVDDSGKLVYLNQAARRMLELDAATPSGHLQDILQDEAAQHLLSVGLPNADTHGVWETELRLQRPDGSHSLPVSLVVLAHRSSEGDEHYYSIVARDMTERALREEQSRHHQEELAHTARLVTTGELASGLAHEINQPLAAIVNYANACQHYLQQEQPSGRERVRQGLERIIHQANHAAAVIKRLRAFLRKGQRPTARVDINEVVREVIRLCEWEATRHGIRVELDLGRELPPVVADRVLLEQVLVNLVRNAVDANLEAGRSASTCVRIATRQRNGQVTISVTDQGPGLPEEALERIFEPFYSSKPQGLGLGLSMSRSIMEGLGGRLNAEQAAVGLTMRCSLPAAGGS